ncbi:MAG: sigma-70 family RNA polymerase sigma factor [bacterium]|nr:sigma-70 family RNA polymerase sigma factor [bacterium]
MDEKQRAAQIELATKGDQGALQRLVVDYHAPLRAFLAGQLDGVWRRRIDPDDVLQDAYVAAFRTVSTCRFDGPPQFYKWMEAIAHNALKNIQRGLKSRKRDIAREIHGAPGSRTSYPDLVGRVAASDSTPSRHVARDEAAAAVLSSLARLSDDQRHVVRMRFLEGRSVTEVATELGKTDAAVHALCRRGLAGLRKSLDSISRYL